ncbi:MAG: 8-amino-7-oxononanoate synthase [Myxococcales bacterium]|nr:8-amino-7-oxononanoate synthase [Myxococcales bacterium]
MPSERPELSHAAGLELAAIRDRGLWRQLREIESSQGPSVRLGGRETLLFCSNNYLGLADHPEVIAAAQEATARFGASSVSSRLVSGHMTPHAELEAQLAAWKDCEAALVFSTGFQANLGVLATLLGPEDLVVSDALNHASIIDGCRLSRARIEIFRHSDVSHLEQILARHAPGARRVLVATESVFSMDGDCAPLREIVPVAKRHGAWLMVDEAHAVGVFGKTGAGLVHELGLTDAVDVQIGTLGKALGSFGAYVAGSRPLIELLVNRARSFIFTTGLPPAAAAAAGAAIALCQREPERAAGLRSRVRELGASLRAAGLDVPHVESQILPVMIGEADRAVRAAELLLERGLYVAAIREPTVAPGTARLRLSVMASLSQEQLDRLVKTLPACVSEVMSR